MIVDSTIFRYYRILLKNQIYKTIGLPVTKYPQKYRNNIKLSLAIKIMERI